MNGDYSTENTNDDQSGNRRNEQPEANKQVVVTTPASRKTAVVVDLTSSPSSTRSRSPIDNQLSSEEFSPQKPTNGRHGRRALRNGNKKPAGFHEDDEVRTLCSSSSLSESSSDDDDQKEPEKVEDGIIGMRIRTPGRRST